MDTRIRLKDTGKAGPIMLLLALCSHLSHPSKCFVCFVINLNLLPIHKIKFILRIVPKNVMEASQLATKSLYHPGSQQVCPERLCRQVSILRDRQEWSEAPRLGQGRMKWPAFRVTAARELPTHSI